MIVVKPTAVLEGILSKFAIRIFAFCPNAEEFVCKTLTQSPLPNKRYHRSYIAAMVEYGVHSILWCDPLDEANFRLSSGRELRGRSEESSV